MLARALDLERQGRWQEAGAGFRTLLLREPANTAALLGAERVYTQLGQRDSIEALVARALAADPAHVIARTIELRVARARGGDRLAGEALGRWIEAAPQSEAPYREWTRLLLADGRFPAAREAVATARQRLGNPGALHAEMAHVEAAAGDWVRAAAEWRDAVVGQPTQLSAASYSLRPAPVAVRQRMLRPLSSDSAPEARRLASDLLLGWNEPGRAWELVKSLLPAAAEARSRALRAFADRARSESGPGAQRVAGESLELLATIVSASEATRARIEAARAYADAGDGEAARRVLRAMAEDAVGGDAAMSASAALVELYVREGNAAEAARLLERIRPRLAGGEAERLQRLLARSWLRGGDLARAEAAVAADSSLAGDEIRGWAALYRGDLWRARELLRGAGARPSEEGGAAGRAAMVALAQAVEVDSLPDLGAALFRAARGDTLGAARALAAVAHSGRVRGEPDLLLLAARWAAAAGDSAAAEGLWNEILAWYPASTAAPAALLGVARALAARGDAAGATASLEAIILNYPESALVPEARRELDRVRGLVPRS